MSEEPTTLKLPGTPKPWMNSAVKTALRTPGLRSLLGRTFMILTVTGAKTGNRYTTPVQYVRDGERLIVLSQQKRTWWRNIPARPDVEIVLKGKTIAAVARLAVSDEGRDAIATSLRLNPRLATFYGIELDDAGVASSEAIDQLALAFIAIVITPSERRR